MQPFGARFRVRMELVGEGGLGLMFVSHVCELLDADKVLVILSMATDTYILLGSSS